MIIGVMFFSTANAGTFHWEGSISTDWSNPNNWLEGSLPGINDDVIFDGNAANICTINQDVSIYSLYISVDYLLQVIIPVGINVYIAGDLTIEDNAFLSVWDNSGNIIFNGTGTQTITIQTYGDWPFYDFTIDKPSGEISLGSSVLITNSFNNINNTPILTNGFTLEGVCTPPQTGSIYSIPNSWGL